MPGGKPVSLRFRTFDFCQSIKAQNCENAAKLWERRVTNLWFAAETYLELGEISPVCCYADLGNVHWNCRIPSHPPLQTAS
jgi:hypothetical protein